MRINNLFIRVPDNFNVFMVGDTQWGNVGTHEAGIDRAFDMINSEYRGCKTNIVCWMGDTVDCIDVKDKRFAFDTTVPKLKFLRAQIDHAVNRMSAIKENTKILMKGNHEHKVMNTYGDVGAEIAAAVGSEYGLYCCIPQFLRQKDDSPLFRFWLNHGFGQVRSNAKDSVQAEANMRASLKNKLQALFAGAVVMAIGHTHHLRIVEPDDGLQLIADNNGDIKQVYPRSDGFIGQYQNQTSIPPDYRWYVNTGSFLKLYSEGSTSYAEMKGLRPVELGFCVAAVRDCKVVKVYKEVV